MDPLIFDTSSANNFILAADPQFSNFSPEEDQVWELDLVPTRIYPFHINTTYGLQASSMRVFPNLLRNKQSLFISEETSGKIHVTEYFPSLLRIHANIEKAIEFDFTIFAIEPDVLVGDVSIKNGGINPLDLELHLAAILTPLGVGTHSHPEKKVNQHIVSGHSADHWPVLIMSGGPSGVSNPYPALSLPLHILETSTARVGWALATRKSQSASLTKAQEILASNWREQAARQRMYYEANTIGIKTGNPDWDAAFLLAQNCAMSHLVPTSEDEREQGLTRSRLPDDTPSQISDTQKRLDTTTLETFHLAQVFLPTHPEIFKQQINAFLNRVKADGSLDSLLQTSPFLKTFKEPPLLARLCRDYFNIRADKDFLAQTFPSLCRIFNSWLPQSKELTGDSLPTWQNPQQLQIESGLFSFDIWDVWGRGIDIQCVNSPALAAMLLSETKALMEISRLLGDDLQYQNFLHLSTVFEEAVQNFWVESRGAFCYMDIQSGHSPDREFYYPAHVQDRFDFNKTFLTPQRILCHLYTKEEKTHAVRVILKGTDQDGSLVIEDFGSRDMHWILGRTHIMTDHHFQTLESLSIEGLTQDDHVLVVSADLEQTDISCLLPIWGGGINDEQLDVLLGNTLNPQDSGLRGGIPETWPSRRSLPENLPIYINVMWNTLIISGLLKHGFINEVRDIFSNLMETIVSGLKNHSGFFPLYDREKNMPAGGRNAIGGLAPLQLFLEISGVKLFSPNRIAIWGSSPFTEPIEVHWQGLSLRREGSHTRITFPNGAIYDGDSEEPKIITSDIRQDGEP